MTRVFCSLSIFIFIFVTTASLAAGTAMAQTDVLPPLDGAKLQFGTGKVVNNQPQYSPVLPALTGPLSGWHLTQWQQSTLIAPEDMRRDDAASADSILGPANYAFTAPDGHAHLWVFLNGPNRQPVYELYEHGGTLMPGGGSNVFLSADTDKPAPSLAEPLHLSLLAKVSRASISYDTPAAQQSGAVLGMSFAGFVLQFPSTGGTSTLFMQLPLTNSRGRHALIVSCTAHNTLLSGGASPGPSEPLPFQADFGPLHRINFELNAEWAAITANPVQCRGAGRVDFSQLSLASVTVRGIYVGLETQNIDNRPNSKYPGMKQGDVTVGLQLADIELLAGN